MIVEDAYNIQTVQMYTCTASFAWTGRQHNVHRVAVVDQIPMSLSIQWVCCLLFEQAHSGMQSAVPACTVPLNLLAYSQTLERYHLLHHCGLGKWAQWPEV